VAHFALQVKTYSDIHDLTYLCELNGQTAVFRMAAHREPSKNGEVITTQDNGQVTRANAPAK
jgi:hypothetical protein